MNKILFRDKRTDVDLEYDTQSVGSKETQRLFDMAGADIIREVINLNQSIAVDFYLNPWDIDKEFLKLASDRGTEQEHAKALARFARGKKHVAVCRDWINGVIYLKEVVDA